MIDRRTDRAAGRFRLAQHHERAGQLDEREGAILHGRPAKLAPELPLRVEIFGGEVQVAHHDAGIAGRGQLRANPTARGGERGNDQEHR